MVTLKDYPSYEIDKSGRVRNKRTKKFLTQQKSIGGYYSIALKNAHGEKRLYVHRLVAETFIPNPDNKPQVNHKNSIKGDNRTANLEWVSASENAKHSYDNNPVVRLTLKKNSDKRKNPVVGFSSSGQTVSFPSIKAAHEAGYDASSIRKNLNGLLRAVKGFVFKEEKKW